MLIIRYCKREVKKRCGSGKLGEEKEVRRVKEIVESIETIS